MFAAMHSWSFRDRFKQDPSYDIFKCLEEIAEMGFRGIEIMAGKAGSPAEHLGSDDPAHLQKVVQRAGKLGVKILSLATYNDFAFVANEEWRLAITEVTQMAYRSAAEGREVRREEIA